MKYLLIILGLLVLIGIGGFFYTKNKLANAKDEHNLEASIDEGVQGFINQGNSYGMVVGVYKDGKTLIKGYGSVIKDSSTPPTEDTIFQVASITKLFTASTYQILADEKVFSMDATLNDILGKKIELSPEAKKVTLRELATHTSGFPSIPKPLETKAAELVGTEKINQNPFGYLGPEYMFEYLKTTDDKGKVGTFEYSNYGMGLLGHVMETVTQKDLNSLFKEKLLTPLDMKNTGLVTPEVQKHVTQGYNAEGNPASIWTFAALAGAGALTSNANDMMKFVKANTETSSSSLSQSLARTHEKQSNGKTSIGWMQPTFFDTFAGNTSILWHNGMVGGYASYISIDPTNKTGLVILSNKAIDVTMLGMILTQRVRTQSWSSKE